MGKNHFKYGVAGLFAMGLLAGCGARDGEGLQEPTRELSTGESSRDRDIQSGTSIFDLFNRGDNETKVSVNRYLWAASLEVLNFLPIETVDPFTGVIVTGFGTPPGGNRPYRATVLVNDPALDARSLNVSLQTRSGPANAATVRAIEDAILSRARQLRIADSRF